jgi:hypothetical protein
VVRRALVLVVLGAAGCPSYDIYRAGATPHFAPAMHSGRPLERQVEGSIGSIGSLAEPTEGENTDTAIRVPRRQFDMAMRASPFEGWYTGFIWQHGFGNESTPIRLEGSPQDTRDRDPAGPGIIFGSTMENKSGFGMGVEGQLIMFFLPYDVEKVCTADCNPSDPTVLTRYSGRAVTPVAVLTFTPNYRAGPVRVFGSFTLRNHTNVRYASIDAGLDTGVDLGPIMVGLGAGAELTVPPGINLALSMFQPYSAAPIFGDSVVDYSPTLAFWVSFPMTDEKPKPRPKKEKEPENDFKEPPPPIRRDAPPDPDGPSPDPKPARPPVDDGPIK